jgi:hypothetical protein
MTLVVPRIQAMLSWSQQKSVMDVQASASSSFSWTGSLNHGTGAGQADRIHFSRGTIAASANLDIDLSGSLQDIFGGAVVFARVKTLYVELLPDTNASSITVGGAGTGAFVSMFGGDTHKIRIHNGGVFLISSPSATGYVVTPTSADILRLSNEDNTNVATYRIAVIGASA